MDEYGYYSADLCAWLVCSDGDTLVVAREERVAKRFHVLSTIWDYGSVRFVKQRLTKLPEEPTRHR